MCVNVYICKISSQICRAQESGHSLLPLSVSGTTRIRQTPTGNVDQRRVRESSAESLVYSLLTFQVFFTPIVANEKRF